MLHWLDGRFPRLHSRPVMLFAAVATLPPIACADLEPSAAAGGSNGAARPDGHPAPDLLNRVTNAYPARSPDGQQVAYMSTADGDFDIYVVSPATGGRAKPTDTEAREGTPVWSPDGSRIAFQSFRDGHSQIYVMSADGSEQRNLSNNTWLEHPYWSADGERLLFASDREASDEAPDNVDIFDIPNRAEL